MRRFLLKLIDVLINVIFAVGLPIGAFLLGEMAAGARYPHATYPFSGVGLFGVGMTLVLWCVWSDLSLKVNIFAAVARIALSYLLVFLPAFWFIKSNNVLGAGFVASLAYGLVGYSALTVWEKQTLSPGKGVIRGSDVPLPGSDSYEKAKQRLRENEAKKKL